VFVVLGIWLAFFVQPEVAPMWVKRFWGISQTVIQGSSKPEAAHTAVTGQIWRGREIFPRQNETRSQLELKELATREEAANADSRVDGRTRYRIFWLVVSFIGVLMMIFGLGTDPDRDRLRGNEPSGGGATQPSGHSSTPSTSPSPEGYAPYNPFSDVPTAFAQTQAPAQTGQDRMETVTDEVGDDPSELFLRWTDRGPRGETSSHELVIGGEKLDEATSVQVYFDLKNGTLLSAKPTVNFDRD